MGQVILETLQVALCGVTLSSQFSPLPAQLLTDSQRIATPKAAQRFTCSEDVSPRLLDGTQLLLAQANRGLELADHFRHAGVVHFRERGQSTGQVMLRRPFEILLGFQLTVKTLGLECTRHLRFGRRRRKVGAEAMNIRQPAPRKGTSAYRKVLPERLDDVGNRLVVGRT